MQNQPVNNSFYVSNISTILIVVHCRKWRREWDILDSSHKPLKLVHYISSNITLELLKHYTEVLDIVFVVVHSTQGHIEIIKPYINFSAYAKFICLFLSVLLDLIWGPRKHYHEAAFLEKNIGCSDLVEIHHFSKYSARKKIIALHKTIRIYKLFLFGRNHCKSGIFERMENFQNDWCRSWTKKPFKNSRQLRILNAMVWSPAGQIDWPKSVFLQTKATHFETMMTTVDEVNRDKTN